MNVEKAPIRKRVEKLNFRLWLGKDFNKKNFEAASKRFNEI